MTPEPKTATPTPLELSQAYINAYNRGDEEALRSLLAPELEWIRPGPVTLTKPDEVMAKYEELWGRFEHSRIDIRSYVEDEDTIAAEITISVSTKGRDIVMEGVVIHQWRNGQLVRYRIYYDPLPSR
jgi:ketosteroid isomerase-like protein